MSEGAYNRHKKIVWKQTDKPTPVSISKFRFSFPVSSVPPSWWFFVFSLPGKSVRYWSCYEKFDFHLREHLLSFRSYSYNHITKALFLPFNSFFFFSIFRLNSKASQFISYNFIRWNALKKKLILILLILLYYYYYYYYYYFIFYLSYVFYITSSCSDSKKICMGRDQTLSKSLVYFYYYLSMWSFFYCNYYLYIGLYGLYASL